MKGEQLLQSSQCDQIRHRLGDFLGINVWPLTPTTRNFGLRIRDPWQYQNLTFFDYLRVAASKDDTVTNLKLQEASLHHSHKADCFDYGRRKIYAVSYIVFREK